MARRTLSLKRETLAELSVADLSAIAGAADITPTTPILQCMTISAPDLHCLTLKNACGGTA